MHLEGAFRDVALRIDISVKGPPGDRTPHQFNAADFNDPVALIEPESGSFEIENYLPHDVL